MIGVTSRTIVLVPFKGSRVELIENVKELFKHQLPQNPETIAKVPQQKH